MHSAEPVKLQGVFPMLVTPFGPAGDIDFGDLRRLLAFVLESGAHGVSILGLGGEVGRLAEDERRSIADLVLREAGKTPVIVGCTAQDTEAAVALARHATERGAAALMVAPPSIPAWGRERMIEHFVAVARASAPTPLMIQDAPAFVGVALDEALVRHLAATESNVTHAKPEGLPAGEWASKLVDARLTVFGGHGGLYVMDILEAGGSGLIPGCEATSSFVRLFDAWSAGRVADAWTEYGLLVPLLAFEFEGLDHYVQCVKTLLHELGVVRTTGLRGKPDPLSPIARQLLLARAERAGLLPPSATAWPSSARDPGQADSVSNRPASGSPSQ